MFVRIVCVLVLCVAPVSVFALVDINTASVSELDTLDGIGPSKAQSIIDYRDSNGDFASIDEITNVSGIGPATFGAIKNDITVGTPSSDGDEDENGNEEDGDSDDADVDTESESDTEEVSSGGGSDRRVTMDAYISVSAETVVVGMPITFTGTRDGTISGVGYRWNFGDGTTGRGAKITHTYEHPGTYVATVRLRHRDKEQSDMIEVAVIEPSISIASIGHDYVALRNGTDVTADISQWALLNNRGERYVFPRGSHIAAGALMRIQTEALGLSSYDALIFMNAQNAVVASYPEVHEQIPAGAVTLATPARTVGTGESESSALDEEPEPEIAQTASAGSAFVESEPSGDGASPMWLYTLGLFALIVVPSIVLFVLPQKKEESYELAEAEEIDIIE